MHDKTLSVVAMRVSDPYRSAIAIHSGNTTPTPTVFLEIVSDDFSVFHERARFQLAYKGLSRNPSKLGKASGKWLSIKLGFSPGCSCLVFLNGYAAYGSHFLPSPVSNH
jgi:hypothetical protein